MIDISQPNTCFIFTDGGSRGNPGEAAIGVIGYQNGVCLFQSKRAIGIETNNSAEYQAFLHSVELLAETEFTTPPQKVVWYLDSKLVVEQLNGRWKVKDSAIRAFWQQCQNALKSIAFPYEIHHVPREENVEADALVNEALDEL